MATKVKKLQIDGESVYPATILDAIKDPVKTIGGETNPNYNLTLREILENELDSAKMEDGYTADVIVGGLNKGTDVGGMTATEVLDLILKPEYAPVYTAATATISNSDYANGDVVEVGTKTPASSTYSAEGNKAKTAAGTSTSHVKYGGEATVSYSITSATAGTSLTYDTVTTKPGVFTVKASLAYAAGTDVVETNKGNATNKTASNYTTLLANASADSKIDASNHIKAVTKEASLTINYAYKVYASNTTAGTLTSLGLKKSVKEVEATLKGGAAGLMFAIPSSYTGVKIEEYNDTLGSWTDVTDTWTGTASADSLATNGAAYTVYKRSKNSGEDMKARISATVA